MSANPATDPRVRRQLDPAILAIVEALARRQARLDYAARSEADRREPRP